jgi:lipoprotein-releasing system permease protein
MAQPNIDFFIARRLSDKGVVSRIAVATTAVSIAVMILAVAVIMGFRAEISTKITTFTGHLKVQALDYSASLTSSPITLSNQLEAGIRAVQGVTLVAPYALKLGMAKTTDATRGVMLKGVDHGADLSMFQSWLVAGTLPRLSGDPQDSVRHKDILISETVGQKLRLEVDDRLEVIFVDGNRPRRDRFRVCGLYTSGFGELDEGFALVDIANIRRLNNWTPDQASGYEISIDDFDRLGEVEQRLVAAIAPHDNGQPRLMVRSVVGEFPLIFDWLATHDVNAAVIIVIMIVVALVSMISALLIIVLERIRMIGVLKTLGMRNGSLRRIFVIRAARIVLVGLLVGNIVGIGAALIQSHFGILTLDSTGYFVSRVPIELGWWIVALDAGVAAVLIALMILPTSIVGRISPEKTIRYQ